MISDGQNIFSNLRQLIRPFEFPFFEEYFCKHQQIDLLQQCPNHLEIVERFLVFQGTLRQFCYLELELKNLSKILVLKKSTKTDQVHIILSQ